MQKVRLIGWQPLTLFDYGPFQNANSKPPGRGHPILHLAPCAEFLLVKRTMLGLIHALMQTKA